MKILIIDNHRIVIDGLRALLERSGFSVVGFAMTGREAISLARELRPDVVIIELATPDPIGSETLRTLCHELPELKVLALSTKADRHSVLGTFAAGAHGYLPKSAASAEELLQAIRAVASGHKYVSPAIASLVLLDSMEHAKGAHGKGSSERRISTRERDVLKLLAEGRSSKEIASTLRVALPTVETHRRQIMTKLGIRSIAELTKYAVREGLTSLDAE